MSAIASDEVVGHGHPSGAIEYLNLIFIVTKHFLAHSHFSRVAVHLTEGDTVQFRCNFHESFF